MKIINKPYNPNKKSVDSQKGKIDKHKAWMIFGILSVIIVLGILAFSVYQGETLAGEASKFDPKGQIKAVPEKLKKTPPPDPKISLGCGDIKIFSLAGKDSAEAIAKRKQICQSAGCKYVPNADPSQDKCTGTMNKCPPIELWDYAIVSDNTARKGFCGSAISLGCKFYESDSNKDNYIGDFCSKSSKPCKPNGDLDLSGTIDIDDLSALQYVVQAKKTKGNTCGIPGKGTCNFPNAKMYVCKNGKAYSSLKVAADKPCEDTCPVGDLVTLGTELKPTIDDYDVFALQYVISAQSMNDCGFSGKGTCDFPNDGIFVCKSGKAYLKSIPADLNPCN